MTDEMMIPEAKIPHAVRNEWFYLFARGCGIFLTFVGLPLMGAMLSRAVASADEIRAQLTEQNLSLRLLSSEVKIRFDNDGKNITDHEIRMRALERTK
jgi:hypothetical protein